MPSPPPPSAALDVDDVLGLSPPLNYRFQFKFASMNHEHEEIYFVGNAPWIDCWREFYDSKHTSSM